MGLTTGDFPPVQPAEFMRKTYLERTRVLVRHWVDYGFGAPKITGGGTPGGGVLGSPP